MSPRFVRPFIAALLAASTVVAPAQPPAAPVPAAPGAPKPKEELFSLKLPDADIDTILGTLESYTGKIILRPASLPTGTYNLKVENKPKAEIIGYILTILSLNRIGVAPLGDNALKVVDLTMTRTEAPEMITGSAFDQPPSGKIATKIFQLDFMRIQDFAAMAQPMLNPNMQGGLVQLPTANAALVTDTVSNLQRIELLLRELDRPSGGMKPKFYQLRSAKASDLVGKIRSILTGPLQIQLGTATTFSADDRTNQIIVITDPRQIEFFDDLIEKLDGKADPNTRNDVLYLKHADATEVATLLTQVVNGQTAAAQRANANSIRPGQVPMTPTPAPAVAGVTTPAAPVSLAGVGGADALLGSGSNEFSSLVTVFADKRSNAIVVSGTVDDLRLIGGLVDKLDTILAQVRLEVVIAEVTLDDNSTTGIGSLGLKVDGDKLVGFSGSISGNGNPSVSITDGVITRPGGTTVVSGPWDLAGTISINSTPRKNNANILSSPSITTTHNKEAIFFFGETRPIISGTTATPTTGGTTTGFSTQSNITPQEIGTTITIKPLIGPDGTVQLDIKTDISDVTGTVTIDNNTQYIIGKRKTTSYVTARSNQIIVLGGYRKDKDSLNTNRLGPIPIIGDLLGGRSKAKNHVELVIFLRPVVLTNTPADAAEALKQVDQLEQKELIRQRLDPAYIPPKKSLIDKVLH